MTIIRDVVNKYYGKGPRAHRAEKWADKLGEIQKQVRQNNCIDNTINKQELKTAIKDLFAITNLLEMEYNTLYAHMIKHRDEDKKYILELEAQLEKFNLLLNKARKDV